jgi:hypothetical protein
VEGSCEHGNKLSGSIKFLENIYVDAQLAAAKERLSSMELVNVCLVISKAI